MPVVTMPDGVNVSFPDEMPRDQIKAMIAQKFPDAVKGVKPKSWTDHIPRAFADIPSEIGNAFTESAQTFKKEMFPPGPPSPRLNDPLWLARAAGGALGVLSSPITGTARSLLGHPIADYFPGGEGPISGTPEERYAKAKDLADTAMMAGAPRRVPGLPSVAPTPPAPPVPNGPLGVTLSEGQASRMPGAAQNLPAIQREQAAIRKPDSAGGPRAQEFTAQQAGEVNNAYDRVAQGFDQFGGQQLANTASDAGQMVQGALQAENRSGRARVDQGYARARALPGEIDASGFDNIGQTIRGDLSNRAEPVIIDDRLTPYASRAIQEVEGRIEQLNIQNRAAAQSPPPRNQIVGVSLNGVDQMRKQLVAMRRDAFASGNGSDGRATGAVLDAFDTHVDNLINGGAFRGDPAAVQAWNAARAENTAQKRTFGNPNAPNKNPVDRKIQEILGDRAKDPATPTNVADFLYGAQGTRPSSLNVNVATRVRNILGDQSPEWVAAKQGLFARLVETAPGANDMGPARIANRISEFLDGNGRDLAHAVYSPQERGLIRQYATLHRALEVPQAGANWSNTATFAGPVLHRIAQGVGALVGSVIGHTVAPGLMGAGEGAGALAGASLASSIANMSQARQIAQQMPLVIEATRRWQRAMAAYTRANTPPSQIAAHVTTVNLMRSLKQIGVDISQADALAGDGNEKKNQGAPGPSNQ